MFKTTAFVLLLGVALLASADACTLISAIGNKPRLILLPVETENVIAPRIKNSVLVNITKTLGTRYTVLSRSSVGEKLFETKCRKSPRDSERVHSECMEALADHSDASYIADPKITATHSGHLMTLQIHDAQNAVVVETYPGICIDCRDINFGKEFRTMIAKKSNAPPPWATWDWHSQLSLGKSISPSDASAGVGVSEAEAYRLGVSLGCHIDDNRYNSPRANLTSGMGFGLHLFLDDKSYGYQRSENSNTTETASATASGYGLLFHLDLIIVEIGMELNQLYLNDSLEFTTMTYSPGLIKEQIIGAYYDLGRNFYNLSLGLELIEVSSADDLLITDSDKLMLTLSLDLLN